MCPRLPILLTHLHLRTMPVAYAYDRLLKVPDRGADNFPGRQRAERCFSRRLAGAFEPGRWFVDDADAAGVAFLDRPAVAALLDDMRDGDALIVPRWERTFVDVADFQQTLDLFALNGNRLIVADMRFDSAGTAGRLALRIIARQRSATRHAKQEKLRRTQQQRREFGRAPNQFAGLGFCWAGPKGRRYRVPDPAERTVMARIVALREAGQSFGAIARQFLRERIEYRPGQEWSESRIRRGYQAELRLRESQPATATPAPA